jgi:hypothetical protein
MIPLVIVPDTFLSQAAVVLSVVILSHNLDHLIPILFPTLMVEVEHLFQGIEFGHFQIPIELLQSIVDPGTHERLNAFCFDFNLVNIGEFVLVGTVLIGGEL